MKVSYTKILLLTIASVGLSAGLLYAAKPSLSAVKNATTVGDLLQIIRGAGSGELRGNFFVWNGNKYTAPDYTKLGTTEEELTATPLEKIGGLHQDPAQIDKIKEKLKKTGAFRRLGREKKNRVLAQVDQYQNYLWYFTYKGTKFYVNDPSPQASIDENKAIPTAIYNIMQKWAK